MRKSKKVLAFLMAMTMMLGVMTGCSEKSPDETQGGNTALVTKDYTDAWDASYQWVLVESETLGNYYALEGVTYVSNPVAPEYCRLL